MQVKYIVCYIQNELKRMVRANTENEVSPIAQSSMVKFLGPESPKFKGASDYMSFQILNPATNEILSPTFSLLRLGELRGLANEQVEVADVLD